MSITMRAPKERIFETAADLSAWPRILPHYRYIKYYEQGPVRNVVKMAAKRSGIPIAWTSEQIIDREKMEVRFTHLKAFTKGMHVVWTFKDTPEGVYVEIVHDLHFRVPALAPLADKIIGGFFIDAVAARTLRCMKAYLGKRGKIMRRAVITGLGPITCVGIGREAFWNGLRAQKSGIDRLTAFDSSEYNAHHAGEVRDYDPAAFFPPHRLKRLDRYAQFAVASAKLALEDAGLNYTPEEPQARVGVSFGTALGGIAGAEFQHAHFLKKGTRGVNQTLALQVFGGSAHTNIAIEFGLRGVGTTNSNSCASGTVAVGEALRYIRDGFADVIVAGAAEAPLSPLTFGAFSIIKTMSQWEGEPAARACRPFDRTRDGFVMGEGAASLIIEEYEHAKARGAHIYAEVLGYSLNNDAFHMTTPLADGACAIAAMRGALADARLRPEEIDHVNAHASSTQVNDSTETLAIKTVLGEHAYKIPVSGTKAYHAHPLGATGAIETVVAALTLARGWVPPTLHHEDPDPACDLDIVPNEGRDLTVRRILSNSFGFGGINSCLVLGKV